MVVSWWRVAFLPSVASNSQVYFLFSYDLDRSTTHPKFGSTRVQTHAIQISWTIHFMSLALTFEPPGTLKKVLTLKALVATIDAQWEGMVGCRVGKVRAGTTSPMPDHKGFKLQ